MSQFTKHPASSAPQVPSAPTKPKKIRISVLFLRNSKIHTPTTQRDNKCPDAPLKVSTKRKIIFVEMPMIPNFTDDANQAEANQAEANQAPTTPTHKNKSMQAPNAPTKPNRLSIYVRYE